MRAMAGLGAFRCCLFCFVGGEKKGVDISWEACRAVFFCI